MPNLNNTDVSKTNRRIIVACPSLNYFGGAERLCVYVIKTLKEKKFNVVLVTLDKTDWTSLEKIFGRSLRPDKEVYPFNRMPQISNLTLRQGFIALSYAFELFLVAAKKRNALLMNMRGEIVDTIGDIIYVNAVPLKLMYVYPEIQPDNGARWRVFSRIYSLLLGFLKAGKNTIIANSVFNRDIIEEKLGKKTLIVHPAVDVQRIKLAESVRKRKNIVVTVSRFRSAKGLEIIPKIAKLAKKADFTIIGTLDQGAEQPLRQLTKRIEEAGLRNRIRIFTNKTLDFTLTELLTAKIFLHTQPMEAFGMAIVEAMVAGCVPVVPRNGGPWFDTLGQEQGKYGYSYDSAEEAAGIIDMLIEDDCLRLEVSKRAAKRADDFDVHVFNRKILSIIEKMDSS
jgi:glycosyltransferase involved in cell wall biosynthesis